MKDLKLQIAICTFRKEGLERVAKMHLPPIAGVGYVISCQSEPQPLPPALQREDIVVCFTHTTGLSNNRNNAFSLVTAPIALIADDDLIFHPEGIKQIIEKFDNDPSLDIATFKCLTPYPTTYPDQEHDISRKYKNYNIVSFEIAVRMASIRRIGVEFTPLMGIGAKKLHAGEENIFVHSCLRHGLKGRFFPIVIATHPAETTGIRLQSSPGVLRANGAYVCIAYPGTATLRLPLIAWRTKGPWLVNLYHLTYGAIYAIFHRKQLLK